jgi:hypothetical protein
VWRLLGQPADWFSSLKDCTPWSSVIKSKREFRQRAPLMPMAELSNAPTAAIGEGGGQRNALDILGLPAIIALAKSEQQKPDRLQQVRQAGGRWDAQRKVWSPRYEASSFP